MSSHFDQHSLLSIANSMLTKAPLTYAGEREHGKQTELVNGRTPNHTTDDGTEWPALEALQDFF